MEDRRQLSSLGLGMFALGLAQAEVIWMLLQPAGARLCYRVAPFLGEGWEMVTRQSEAGTCSLSGRCCVFFTEGPLPNTAHSTILLSPLDSSTWVVAPLVTDGFKLSTG